MASAARANTREYTRVYLLGRRLVPRRVQSTTRSAGTGGKRRKPRSRALAQPAGHHRKMRDDYTFCVNIWSDFEIMIALFELTWREESGAMEAKERGESARLKGEAVEGKRGAGRASLYGQLNEITRNRKLSDVPILLEPSVGHAKMVPMGRNW